MPDAALTQALKEAYAAAPSNVVILHTLELRHPNFTQPARVVNDHNDLLARLEASAPENPLEYVTFQAFAWQMTLPGIDESASPEIVLVLDGVSDQIVKQLELAKQSQDVIEVTYRPFLSTDLSAPAMNPPLTLVMTQVTADSMRVTARVTYQDLANRAFPGIDYTAERFPGLIR